MGCVSDGKIKLKALYKPAILIFAIGVIIRLIVAPLVTNSYDVTYWAYSIQNIQSGNELYEIPGYYYSQIWGYFLGFWSEFMNLIGVSTTAVRFDVALPIENLWWPYYSATLTTVDFNFWIKIPMIVSDCFIGYLLYDLIKKKTSSAKKATLGMALWMLCPTVIYTCALHGAFDTFSTLLLIISILLLMKDRYFFAGMCFSIAVLTKFFPGFFIFMLVAYVLCKYRDNKKLAHRNLAVSIAGVVFMTAIIYIPQIMDGTVIDTLYFLSSRVETGLTMPDRGNIYSIVTSVGYSLVLFVQPLILLGVAYLGYRMYKSKRPLEQEFPKYLLFTAVLIFIWPPSPPYLVILVPFLAYYTAVHDRSYLVPWAIIGFSAMLYDLVMNSASIVLPLAAFTDILDLGAMVALLETLVTSTVFGINVMVIMMGVLAVIQTIGIWMVLYKMFITHRNERRQSSED